jgi:RNA polymerase sigma-70 factor (ECF subfamily)
MVMRHNWSDDDLARRLYERDSDALEILISRYSREVFYFICLVLEGIGIAQDAEECVNDLFVAVWQEIGTFDPSRGTLRTWLTMRAKYIALDRRRQLYRRQAYSIQYPEATMEALLEESERREELRIALATLPEIDRYLIYQRYFKLTRTEELAKKTGLTRHAIDTRLWRARKSLRKALKERVNDGRI